MREARERAGLPHNDDSACRNLLMHVVLQGLTEDDSEFVLSDNFAAYCTLLGFTAEQVLAARLLYCWNALDVSELDIRRVHADRYRDGDPKRSAAEQQVPWQAWPEKGPLRKA